MIKRIRNKLEREAVHFKKSLVEKGFVSGTTNYTKFIVLSSIRSGSTMLGSYLSSSPSVVCFFELFHRHQDSVPFGISGYEKRGIDPSVVKLRNNDPVRFLSQYVFNRHCLGTKAVGFKLLYTQGHSEEQWWNGPEYNHWWRLVGPPPLIPSDKSNLWQYLSDNKNIVILHLVRRNHLARLISFHKALRMGHWGDGATGGYGGDKPMAVEVDPVEFRKDVEASERLENEMDATFQGHPIVKVIYEDLVTNASCALEPAIQALGLERINLATQTRKQNRQPISDSIRNFEELRRSFAGTKWDYMFEPRESQHPTTIE